MNELQPSKLINQHLGWINYGLSKLNKSIPGENNMSYPGNYRNDPRRIDLADAARKRFISSIGIERIHALAQPHNFGYVHEVVHGGGIASLDGADALVTNQPGIALATLYADCSAVFLVDPVRRAIGLAHAGWQGTLHNVVGNMINAMEERFRTKPSDLVAYMGPTICFEHYNRGYTDEEVGLMINLILKTGVEPVYARKGPWILADIVATNAAILQHYGIRHVESSGICTYAHEDQPSARRDDRQLGGPYRSNAMAVMMIRP